MHSSTSHLPYIQTPLIPSLYLSELTNTQVFLKLETAQPSGSFKSRGLGHLVRQTIINHQSNPETTQQLHFFSPSGGNAGCATAYAARQYNQACTVCVPASTSAAMVERIRKTGARVVVHGQFIADADRHVREVLMPACNHAGNEKAVYCHPYDDKLVWDGNETIAHEIVAAFGGPGPVTGYDSSSEESDLEEPLYSGPRPDAVICSVGGGGLFNGLTQGFTNHGWHDVHLVAVETDGSSALSQSLSTNTHVHLAHPRTIATSLATSTITKETLYHFNSKPSRTHSLVVSDHDAAAACIAFARDHKLLIEAACGTALAPLYNGSLRDLVPGLREGAVVVVVVCGGTNVGWEMLRQYSEEFGIEL